MEYKHQPESEFPHVFTFDQGWEIKVIRAAYREAIMNRARKGNTSSISEVDARLSTYPRKAETLVRALRKTEEMTEILQEFVDNTDDAIARIPEETRIAAFENDKIGQRMKAGEEAQLLITEMVQAYPSLEMTEGMAVHELSEDEQVENFKKNIPDALPEDME